MAKLLIVAHAPLASALKAVAMHAFPEQGAGVAAVDVTTADDISVVEGCLRAQLPEQGEALLLSDVFGATPCNAAMRVADGAKVRLLAGVNVPMLWRALTYVDEPLEALCARAAAGAAHGILQVASSRPQNQSSLPNSDDPNASRHQQ